MSVLTLLGMLLKISNVFKRIGDRIKFYINSLYFIGIKN